jgi:hypothetical protein
MLIAKAAIKSKGIKRPLNRNDEGPKIIVDRMVKTWY